MTGLQQKFKNAMQYSKGVDGWCKALYNEMTDCTLSESFCAQFALVDWDDDLDLLQTFYGIVKEKYLKDYKKFTEIVISINLLKWANDRFVIDGLPEREKFTKFYKELYYVARSDYYRFYRGCQEECDYLYSMSD